MQKSWISWKLRALLRLWSLNIPLSKKQLVNHLTYIPGRLSGSERSTDIMSLTNSLKEACFHPACTCAACSGLARTGLPLSPGALGLRGKIVTSILWTKCNFVPFWNIKEKNKNYFDINNNRALRAGLACFISKHPSSVPNTKQTAWGVHFTAQNIV